LLKVFAISFSPPRSFHLPSHDGLQTGRGPPAGWTASFAPGPPPGETPGGSNREVYAEGFGVAGIRRRAVGDATRGLREHPHTVARLAPGRNPGRETKTLSESRNMRPFSGSGRLPGVRGPQRPSPPWPGGTDSAGG